MKVGDGTAKLLSAIEDLPEELVHLIRNGTNTQYLEAITSVAGDARYTDRFVSSLDYLLVEVIARWTKRHAINDSIPLFGRILHNAPYLAEAIQAHLSRCSTDGCIPLHSRDRDEASLLEILLGLHRLLVFDGSGFRKFINPVDLQAMFDHQSRPVRYLAIRCLSLHLGAADAAVQKMIRAHLGSEAVLGTWETKNIDYRFFSLWEEQRYKRLASASSQLSSSPASSQNDDRHLDAEDWSAETVELGDVLLPQQHGLVHVKPGGRFVSVPTADANLRQFARALLLPQPVLVEGSEGSGKTLLITHVAERVGKLRKLITLHLNEQSDAKLLVGMYTTGSKPGTFTWQPGVLTTAVTEGHWVLIEDLDRAPNEILSTLLPLIEKRELLIPSRGQILKAAPGFRLLATTSSKVDTHGRPIDRTTHMLGSRLWTRVAIHSMSSLELRTVIEETFPALQEHVLTILAVFEGLLDMQSSRDFASRARAIFARPVTPRELLRWCSRVSTTLQRARQFDDSAQQNMFLDAVDCFAAAVSDVGIRNEIAAVIAEGLQIPPSIYEHLLRSRSMKDEYKKRDDTVLIGRAVLKRQRGNHLQAVTVKSRPFSLNDHSLRLLEQIAVAVQADEPLLLVGETGTGKTTVVQHLADHLGRKLIPFNLSQQSESGDLLGGFKPVNIRSIMIPLKDEFDELFAVTFGQKKNQSFIEMLGKYFAKGRWKQTCKLWRGALDMYAELTKTSATSAVSREAPTKRQKVERPSSDQSLEVLRPRWERFANEVQQLEARLAGGSDALAFSFVEGSIVKAVRNGDWVLLDEINLASPDTLEALADLFAGGTDADRSIMLTETGSIERVQAHPNFRVFAAMNPATDVGKKDLPMGIRSRFTEIYVSSPDNDARSLQSIVAAYLGKTNDPHRERLAFDVTKLYQEIQKLSAANALVDGAGQKPHYSLRTLTRCLLYALDTASSCTLRRALLEGFHMSFSTLLDGKSDSMLSPLIWNHLYAQHSNARAELSRALKMPDDGRQYVQVGEHWVLRGSIPTASQPQYIITPSVERNLRNLIRAASTRRFPILIQGPTSAGKTSMIEYLANVSGNRFVRINNHEHTDLQEYLGTYVSGIDGKLEFQEGVLVQALRRGHWIVLDELNLAPSDVLEALNRLLDDNRELLIPETQEIIRPHENFMLFATQNPAGLYGGRKVLSRAFRNRFLELHFDDIPVAELQEILEQRTSRPKSWCKHIVAVYKELSSLRQETRMFEQRSFATLRDLFRWAQRDADSKQQLAVNGFMLLGERVRKPEERKAVADVIERTMSLEKPRVHIDPDGLYSAEHLKGILSSDQRATADVVWTSAMRRLFQLVSHALRNNEPVLLVGETGCGKTTVCQVLAEAAMRKLHILNAHQNTETGDIIGAQRPIRNRGAIEQQLRSALSALLELDLLDVSNQSQPVAQLLQRYDALSETQRGNIAAAERQQIDHLRQRWSALFEWSDGPLVDAMKHGDHFLLDEISLADDSVLERLNSVLESQRTLLLAEKGSIDSHIVAAEGFQFLATMNPGGDFGKRELSPALRNRFTEIWVPALSDLDDILHITRARLRPVLVEYAQPMVAFASWFNARYNRSSSSSISIRDMLAWIEFSNRFSEHDVAAAMVHGAAMVFIDTLGANPAALLSAQFVDIDSERRQCLVQLNQLLAIDAEAFYNLTPEVRLSSESFCVGPFTLEATGRSFVQESFSLEAPTAIRNAMRVVRGMQVSKPILLEGSPGVGKTTLVMAIASATGKRLARLNLSEQTDLMDLFGSDTPVEGEQAGKFEWKDGPFLTAMKRGDWVLLDEMNLASQSVLEGLNACLDHRGEVYIAELDQTFRKHPNFRLFAAQNPHHQGGGRKGLPASFVNRFTVVFADSFKPEDLLVICRKVAPNFDDALVRAIIGFTNDLEHMTATHRAGLGSQGSPWEFNLRDILRWLQLSQASNDLLASATPYDLTDIVFRSRFRNASDRSQVDQLFKQHFPNDGLSRTFYHSVHEATQQVGLSSVVRSKWLNRAPATYLDVDVHHLPILEILMLCTTKAWPVIVVGNAGSGKTTLIEQLASLIGATTTVLPLHADIDATDLVGGFEQVDMSRAYRKLIHDVHVVLSRHVVTACEERGSAQTHHDMLQAMNQVGRLDSGTATDHKLRDLRDLILSVQLNYGIDLDDLLQRCDSLSSDNEHSSGPRFQWVDGALIESMQEGTWLILDNANLCSSSVLDRLNSLLEPDGYLTVSEHSDAGGEARLIRPHPNFRIFLTMDPRHGELSRAMRNRAIELYLERQSSESLGRRPVTFITDSSVSRFRNFSLLENDEGARSPTISSDLVTDHLSISDMLVAQNFQAQMSLGLFEAPTVWTASFDHLQGFPPYLANQIQAMYAEVGTRAHADAAGISNEPIHPLNNAALVQSSPETQRHAARLGFMFEMSIVFSKMAIATNAVRMRSSHGKAMTQLERRLKAAQSARSSMAIAVTAEQILAAILDHLQNWLLGQRPHADAMVNGHDNLGGLLSSRQYQWLYDVQAFWWAVFDACDQSVLDEASINATLSVGVQQVLAGAYPSNIPPEAEGLLAAFRTINAGQTHDTGQTQSQIWTHLAPRLPGTEKQAQELLQLEALTRKFTSAAFLSGTPLEAIVEQYAKLREVAASACRASADPASVLSSLQDMLAELPSIRPSRTPHFQSTFFGLLTKMRKDQESDQEDLPNSHLVAKLQVLISLHPSVSTCSKLPVHIQDTVFAYKADDLPPDGLGCLVQQDLHQSFLRDISSAKDSPLRDLQLIHTELDVLSQTVSVCSIDICEPETTIVDKALSDTLSVLVTIHKDAIPDSSALRSYFDQSFARELDEWPNDSMDSTVTAVLEDGLMPVVKYLNSIHEHRHLRLAASASAWLSLSVTALHLYIPSRPNDPVLRPQITRQLFLKKRSSLIASLEALETFELRFSGTASNLRIQQIRMLLKDLGSEPMVANVARPSVSQINSIAEDFRALLRLLDSVKTVELLSTDVAAVELIRRNADRLMKRLSTSYTCYDDLLLPAISFLVCLEVGLALAQQAHSADAVALDANLPLWKSLVIATPVLSSTSSPPWTTMKMNHNGIVPSASSMQLRFQLQHLDLLVTRHQLQSPSNSSLIPAISTALRGLYLYWKDRLANEQRTEAAKSSLYTYRAGQQEEDEVDQAEFTSLFPDYESEQAIPTTGNDTTSPRSLSIRLCETHKGLFGDQASKASALGGVFIKTFALLSDVEGLKDVSSLLTVEDVYPALIMRLQQQRQILGTNPSQQLNFYQDPNAQEALRLHTIAASIERKFVTLHHRWPEHATPADVLRCAGELFSMSIDTPLAKFLTKVEKLHETMHEWQRITSREYSAAELYDELTRLVISWRQLELRTWARLLDDEAEKSREEARSWWFIVYENLIAAPEALLENGQEQQLLDHVPNLLRTLREFVVAAPIGQFQERIQILQHFKRHLTQSATLDNCYDPLLFAVQHLISYFEPFLPSIKQAAAQGRKLLEKEVQDVIRLASWKDTTIDALRQSAKASHRKLFRLVRKFRDVLNRSSESLLQDWPQSAPLPTEMAQLNGVRASVSTSIPDLPAISEQQAPDWASRPSRFHNVGKTVNLMSTMASQSTDAIPFHTTSEVQDFVANLKQSVKELQKVTPQQSTKDNADDIKHLRTRKRRLFADVLKALREMGLKSNVSSATLSTQSSLYSVLTSLQSPLPLRSITSAPVGISESLYKLLHLMDQVRIAVRDHSTELTSAEVARSLAYLESLLHLVIQQYNGLSSKAEAAEKLDLQVSMMGNLITSPGTGLSILTSDQTECNSHVVSQCSALATLLEFLLHVAEAQCSMAGVSAEVVLGELKPWPSRLQLHADNLNSAIRLMPSLISAPRQEAFEAATESLTQLKDTLISSLAQHPQLTPILERLLPWLRAPEAMAMRTDQSFHADDISMFQKTLLTAADAVLGTMQALQHDVSVDVSVEGRSWLISSSTHAMQRLQSCAISRINDHLEDVNESFQRLRPEALPVAAAMVANVMPIFRQYRQSLDDCLQDLVLLHESCCQLANQAADLFLLMCRKGFCTPPEHSQGEEGKGEDLEAGTGLGEGEGPEDISKDIKDDEDLTELAQEGNEKERDGIEDEKDAVDMADEEMAGQLGDDSNNDNDQEDSGSNGDDDQDDLEEQEGDVDDLGPSTVDEKLWDDDQPADTGKEKDNEDGKGRKDGEDTTAQNENVTEAEEDLDPEAAAGQEKEDIPETQNEQLDPTTKEEDLLNLPDDLQMDTKEEAMSDIDEEDLNDDEGSQEVEDVDVGGTEQDAEDDQRENANTRDDLQDIYEDEQDAEAGSLNGVEDETGGDEDNETAMDEPDLATQGTEPQTGDDVAESKQLGTGGETFADEDRNDSKQQTRTASNTAGDTQTDPNEAQTSTSGDKGDQADAERENAGRQDADTPEQRAFRKLGDDLQQWFRQNRQIQEAHDDGIERPDMDMTDADFEHLPNDDAHAEAQAIGAATEEQSHAVDESNAVDVNDFELPDPPLVEDDTMGDGELDENTRPDEAVDQNLAASAEAIGEEATQRTFVGKPQDLPRGREHDGLDDEDESKMEEMDTQLSEVHLEAHLEPFHRSAEEAQALWAQHEASTRDLSLALTEQLRLILEPTLATKMRGDFRTGKRLNIKRIIPYIASQYKRDKIWMRRSVPSKRNYQVMLALDDSKSMAEHETIKLAFDTLALVARALTMLEAGECSVVSFGEDVTIAHRFEEPFGAEAGINVFRRFGFDQGKTDVKKLISRSLDIFREARSRATGSGADLWQLQLVISDGICEDHGTIQRLVRQAQEERIMIVFVIVDAGTSGKDESGDGVKLPPKSITDLQTAEITTDANGDTKLVRRKYLDTFPFRWWIVVRDIRELPGILATALRQWFAEVVETA